MLGVTVSGIFLTPVFFFVIDWLGGPGVYHSATLHRFNQIVRDVITLGALRRTEWFQGRARKQTVSIKKPPAGPTPPASDGIQAP